MSEESAAGHRQEDGLGAFRRTRKILKSQSADAEKSLSDHLKRPEIISRISEREELTAEAQNA